MPSKLTGKQIEGTFQYILDGKPVPSDSCLELLLAGNQWAFCQIIYSPFEERLHIRLGSESQSPFGDEETTAVNPVMVAELPLKHGIFRWPEQ